MSLDFNHVALTCTKNRVKRTLLSLSRRKLILIAVLFLLAASESTANNNQLLILTDSQQALHHLFITQLKNKLQSNGGGNIQLKIENIDDWNLNYDLDYRLVLALGIKAAHKLSKERLPRPIIFSLVSDDVYKESIVTNTDCTTGHCSAIFLNQPVSRVLKLTRIALPHLTTAGILTSRKSNVGIRHLQAEANELDIQIKHQQTEDPKDLVFSLSRVLQQSDALLSLPDHHIYSQHTAQNILLTAYRYRKPVIGYSRAFVKAGALFAVYSTPTQLSLQTTEEIVNFFAKKSGALPPPQYPRHYSVAVNNMVAKSLGINIENEHILLEKLKASVNE